MEISSWVSDRGFWGDVIGFVGFPLTLLGLYLTWHAARKSESAAEAAAQSADNVRSEIGRLDVVSELSKSHVQMLNVKNYLRSGQLSYAQLAASESRERFVRVRSSTRLMSDVHRRLLQGSISLMNQIEEKIDEHGGSKGSMPDKLIIIKQVSEKMDEIQQIITEFREAGAGDARR